MRKNSIKNTRVNAEVQHELANLIREGIKDPRIHPMTSVTAVEVAPDLKTCRAYIDVYKRQPQRKCFTMDIKACQRKRRKSTDRLQKD